MDSLPENADEHWKWLPFRDKGDESTEPIHQAMGAALTTWEGIEYLWVWFFCHFVEGVIWNAAARAYGSIDSSRGRMEALDKAAEVYFHLHGVSPDLQKQYHFVRKHF